jgi:hypothetical protein
VIGITDAVEQSASSWTYYVGLLQGLVDDPAGVVVHAIAGDYPSGCGSFSPGRGWYEATVDTDGLFQSACATDWAAYVEAMVEARHAPDGLTRFRLPLDSREVIDPATIEVRLDGVVETAWTWSDGYDAVLLDAAPAAGVEVEIRWMPTACPDEAR